MQMKTNEFTAVGTIDTVLAPECQLVDGRDIQSVMAIDNDSESRESLCCDFRNDRRI